MNSVHCNNQQGAIPKNQNSNSDFKRDAFICLQNNKLQYHPNNESSLNKSKIMEQQMIEQINAGHKIMIIMRGAPGSGKSHLATKLVKKCNVLNGKYRLQDFILSADDYFYDKNGRYKYKIGKLEDAHAFNQNRAKDKAIAGWSPIIIDNTHMKLWEMMPYMKIGVRRGYIVHLLEPNTPWRLDACKLALKNQHRVSREKIQTMLDKYEKGTINDLLKILRDTKYTVPLPQLRNIPSISTTSEDMETNDTFSEFKSVETVAHDLDNCLRSTGGNNKYTFVDSSFTLVSPKPQRRRIRSRSATKLAIEMDKKYKSNKLGTETSHTVWKSHEEEIKHFWSSSPGDKCTEVTPSDVSHKVKSEKEKTLLELLKEGVVDIRKKIEEKEIVEPSASFEIHKIGCTNENKSFVYLRQIYPNKLPRGLWDLFLNCKGDIDWAVDILLREDELSIAEDYSYQHVQVEDNTFNCGCDKLLTFLNESPKKSHNADINFKRTKSQKAERICLQSKIQTQPSRIALKDANENCVVLGDEHYSIHVKKLLNMQGGVVRNLLNATTYVDVEVQTERSTFTDGEDQDPRSSEFLEVSLGDKLVKQLSCLFASEIINNKSLPDHLVTNVSMPKPLAKELFLLWMESAYNQIEKKRPNVLRGDEDFARLLKTPKYEDIKESPVNIKEILDMELALMMYNDDRERFEKLQLKQQPSDMATNLTQMKLCELFPNIPHETLLDIFAAKGNKFNEAVLVLQGNIERNSTFQNLAGYEVNNKKYQGLHNRIVFEEQQQYKQYTPTDPSNNYIGSLKLKLQTEEAKRLVLHDFEETRNFAAHHSQLKAECYLKAKEALQKGDNYVAVYYSQIANLHKKKIDMYNHRAANCIMEVHKYTQNNPDLLDLHYLHVLEATGCLDLFLDRHITNLRSLTKTYKHVFIITGRGLHSAGGVSTIKNKVKSRLKERSLRWIEVNPGLLKVKVFSASRYSKNM